MKLNELSPRPGSRHRIKRLGAGESSGLGKTCGKGHKGQKARTGRNVRPGFEGGQMPIYRRLPRRGFSNAQFSDVVAEVNLKDLTQFFSEGDTVNEQSLNEKGLLNHTYDVIKLLGKGDLSIKLTIEVDKASASAKKKVEDAGGSLTLRK